jgi:hypothetical protein
MRLTEDQQACRRIYRIDAPPHASGVVASAPCSHLFEQLIESRQSCVHPLPLK